MNQVPTISGWIRIKHFLLIVVVLQSVTLSWADGESAQFVVQAATDTSVPEVESRIRSYVLLYYSEIRNEALRDPGPYLVSLTEELSLYVQKEIDSDILRTTLAGCESAEAMYSTLLECFPDLRK